METNRKHYHRVEQSEAVATPILMNITEGKGRYSQKEFSHILMISRGSLYETMKLLKTFKMRSWISEENFTLLENLINEIAKMLNILNKVLKF